MSDLRRTIAGKVAALRALALDRAATPAEAAAAGLADAAPKRIGGA